MEDNPKSTKNGSKKGVKPKGLTTKKKYDPTKPAFPQLNPKHQEFVKQYILHYGKLNDSYRAVYTTVTKTSVASANAGRLLRMKKIRDALDQEYAKIWKDRDKEIEQSKTYKMIHAIGNSDISEVVEMENGTLQVKALSEIPVEARQAIMGIKYKRVETKDGMNETIDVKMHPKVKALELRAKIQNMIVEKAEVTGDIIIKKAIRPGENPDDEES